MESEVDGRKADGSPSDGGDSVREARTPKITSESWGLQLQVESTHELCAIRDSADANQIENKDESEGLLWQVESTGVTCTVLSQSPDQVTSKGLQMQSESTDDECTVYAQLKNMT